MVIGLAFGIHLDPDHMAACAHWECQSYSAPAVRAGVRDFCVGVEGSVDFVVIAKIAVHPYVDLGCMKWILSNYLKSGRQCWIGSERKHAGRSNRNQQ